MDNPQHYQPLSYALHPPKTSTTPKPGATPGPHNHPPEELEEEEGEDENLVADHLNQNDQASDSSTGKPVGYVHPHRPDSSLISRSRDAPSHDRQFLQEPDPGGKRRPGRPRGSKNRKMQSPTGPTGPTPPRAQAPPSHPTGTGTAPPQLADVNSQNQQVLTLVFKGYQR
jgi:hypothetical protein